MSCVLKLGVNTSISFRSSLMSAFEDLGLLPELIRAVDEMGWLLPSAIQSEAIPLILGGGDVLAAAETGSGKTGAFALPLLQLVQESIRSSSSASMHNNKSEIGPVVLNTSDCDSMLAISPDGLSCQSVNDSIWQGGRANTGVCSGSAYFEVKIEDDGLCRVGWSSLAAAFDIGTDKHSFGYGGSGKKSFAKKFETYGEPFGRGDIIGSSLDWNTRQISFFKNGISLGPAFELPEHFKSGNFLFPSVSIKNSQLSFNFGATSLKFAPPAGCLPIAQMSAECLSANVGSDKQGNRQQAKSKYPTFALIIEPTRELADQVFEEITKFKKYLQSPVISHAVFIGGNDIRENLRTLHDGVHIVIGTPGRISTLISDGNLSMSNCQFLILDEADRLLDTGNSDTILSIFKRMSHPNKQVSLFSATLHSPQIKDFSELVTRQPIWIDLKGKDSVPETVDHAMLVVHPSSLDDFSLSSKSSHSLKTDGVHSNDKLSTICPEFCSESIKLQKPKLIVQLLDAFDMEQCLIFCRTKLDCDNLEQYLNSVDGGSQFRGKTEKGKESSYSCTVLHADRTPAERKRNFQAFKDGDVRCLICTDVAARGLDIAGLPFVINMTLPSLSEDYIHRIGRVGRAECVGLAISLVADCPEKVWYHTCASKGRGCRNVNLTSANGCCIWQEETEYLKAIQTRLGAQSEISILNPDNFLEGREMMIKKYGNHKSAVSADVSKFHLELLRPAWQHLASLEIEAQNLFFIYHAQNSQAESSKSIFDSKT